jgi:hypothetical protein
VAAKSLEAARDLVEEKLGIQLTMVEIEAVRSSLAGKPPFALSEFLNGPYQTLAWVLGNHTKVTWTGPNHVSDDTLVTAMGPGAERFAGLNQNVRFFDYILAAKGLRHTNKRMSYEEAARHMAERQEKKAAQMAELLALYGSCDPLADVHRGLSA